MDRSWLRETVTIASVTGKDHYGKPTYGPQRTIKARVEAVRRLVRRVNGDEAQANHRLYTLDAVQLTDRIWLPGADTSQADASNLPIAVTAVPDKTGSRTLYEVDL